MVNGKWLNGKWLGLAAVAVLGTLPLHAGGDANGDGRMSLADVTALINWLANPDTTHGHQYVDLGLPSGTLWATQNVGADAAYEPGELLAWGETHSKSLYDWDSYLWAAPDTTMTRYAQTSTSLWLADDAASRRWGGLWRMPTLAQWRELLYYCRWSWAVVNGQYGYRVTANGTGIFLPAAGYLRDGSHYENNLSGFYWTCETAATDNHLAYGLYFDESNRSWGNRYRNTGRSVRPVLQPSELLSRYDVNGDGTVSQADVKALVGILLQ